MGKKAEAPKVEHELRMTLAVEDVKHAVMAGVLKDVALERVRQDAKWGEQNRCPMAWITIVAEELGEAAKHALQVDLNWDNMTPAERVEQVMLFRTEMIETAATAVAAIETIVRAKWTPRELRTLNEGKPEN